MLAKKAAISDEIAYPEACTEQAKCMLLCLRQVSLLPPLGRGDTLPNPSRGCSEDCSTAFVERNWSQHVAAQVAKFMMAKGGGARERGESNN